MSWTPERIEEARRLWNTTKLSASQIAKELGGVTANAIVGLAHRKGFSPRAPRGNHANMPRKRIPKAARTSRRSFAEEKVARAVAAKAAVASVDILEIIDRPAPVDVGVLFLNIGSRQCRWPLGGSGIEMVCCGAGVEPGLPYCTQHARGAGGGVGSGGRRDPRWREGGNKRWGN